jgi:hypothetical protein
MKVTNCDHRTGKAMDHQRWTTPRNARRSSGLVDEVGRRSAGPQYRAQDPVGPPGDVCRRFLPSVSARYRLLGNLGAVYALRWERRHTRRGLGLAIDTFRQAADAAPVDSADRIGPMANAALMLSARYARYAQRADLSGVAATARSAAAIDGPAPMLLTALMLAGDLLTGPATGSRRPGRTARPSDACPKRPGSAPTASAGSIS